MWPTAGVLLTQELVSDVFDKIYGQPNLPFGKPSKSPKQKSQIAIRIPVSSTTFKGWSLGVFIYYYIYETLAAFAGVFQHISRVLPNILSYFAK